MAARVVAERLIVTAKRATPAIRGRRRAVMTTQFPKPFQTVSIRYNATKSSPNASNGNPVSESMKDSAAPSGDNTSTMTSNESHHNSAYLGEADSDDGFEANQAIHPSKLEPVDAAQSAYLGEADSDDGHEAERIMDPERFKHHIGDASTSAYLGESDSDDAHEVDRVVDPEK